MFTNERKLSSCSRILCFNCFAQIRNVTGAPGCITLHQSNDQIFTRASNLAKLIHLKGQSSRPQLISP